MLPDTLVFAGDGEAGVALSRLVTATGSAAGFGEQPR
jgi:hypothetical protein